MGWWKRFLLSLLYRGWRASGPPAPGYTFVMPAPVDLPFLTALALSALRAMDLRDCAEVLVVPDAAAGRRVQALQRAVSGAGRLPCPVRLLPVAPRQAVAVGLFARNVGVAHWAQIVEAIDASRTDALFLHDADAFFGDADVLARRYAVFGRGVYRALGVTARADPAFVAAGLQIPATWELIFSAQWVRRWRPIDLKSGRRRVGRGLVDFDTLLLPQYADHAAGGIAVIPEGALLHLSGAIVTYRAFLGRQGRRVADELFRLLFLSLLREAAPSLGGSEALPVPGELALGLGDPAAPVQYRFEGAAIEYRAFRAFMAMLLDAPVFAPHRAALLGHLAPFDQHFDAAPGEPASPRQTGLRIHGLRFV